MIKPTNISPLNMASSMTYECNACGKNGEIASQPFNTENWEAEYKEDPIKCFECSAEITID